MRHPEAPILRKAKALLDSSKPFTFHQQIGHAFVQMPRKSKPGGAWADLGAIIVGEVHA